MNDILDFSAEDLILKLPINRSVKVNLDYGGEKEISNEYGYKEYVIEVSSGYKRLIEFINNSCCNIIHGNCPTCKVETYYTLENEYEIPDDIDSLTLIYYCDCDLSNNDSFPNPNDEAKNKALNLIGKLKFFDKKFTCPKCQSIYRASFALEFHENKNENTIHLIKIGQYPSLQEFAVIDIKKFNKSLEHYNIKNDYRNAIRNHINGDNIAAYVYLRRIIETIIFKTFRINQDTLNMPESKFNNLHINEKIKKLKKYLPEFLVKNTSLYSVLSAGIHNLSEEQCQEYYGILKDSIDIILHQDEAKRKEEEIKRITSTGLQKAVSVVKKQ